MKLSRLVLSLLVLALPKPLLAGPDPLEPLRSLAIQDGGRIKPFDTYARETARRVTGAKPFGFQRVMGLDPVEWVLSMMADPDRWRREPGLIRVTHVGLREAAQLPADKDRYSWDELTKHAGLAAAMEKVHEKVRADREAKLDPVEREVSGLEDTLGILDSVFTLSGIRVVPHPTDPRGTWFSLRDLDDADAAPIMTIRTLRDALLRFAKDGDREHVGPAASALSKRLASMAPDTYPAAKDLQREVHYNTFKPFRLAWLLYLLGFFSLLASLTLGGTFLGRAGLGLSFAAFIIHAYGMVIRSLISGRPPVTNMYESVIWVAWGAMLFALIFEAVYRVRFFAACASGVAVISLILADNVPILDGAIDPLVPVLRDNMWLTIHVLTITLSYAAFFLAMAIAHVCLGLYFFSPGRRDLLTKMSLFLYRCLQVGVLLGAAGTLLGGWWASYSWGRFWGWDAKETSIFVALLFYLAILHGRMVGLLRDFGTAVAGVLGFLGVLWAWYGVNFVLGVGLHSYGFGSGGYAYVGGFVAFEVAVVVAAWLRYRALHKKAPAPAPTATTLQTAP
jgi:ABC-type transport system involved in cytochrome c biogenesis permease subunit